MATITFTVPDEEYAKIQRYAQAKGFGGVRPASTMAHYATFQLMKRNALTKAEEMEYPINPTRAPADKPAPHHPKQEAI